ncbi:MAG: DUF5050 domain-containing protein [Chloroflexota bacterium]
MKQLHNNTRTAWKLVFVTLVASAVLVILLHFVFPQPKTPILYSASDGYDMEIFVMDEDGSNVIQLTDNDADDWGAVWSPNHNYIVFHSDRDLTGEFGIFTMQADGTDVRRLTPTYMSARFPSVSADGRWIAFHAEVNGNWDLYVMNAFGGCLRRITTHEAPDYAATWSPDGNMLAFHSLRNGAEDIYTIDIDGTNLTRLTQFSTTIDTWPQWSPDGESILFHSERNGNSDIYIMDADGSNQRALTTDAGLDRVARFSPDGNSIIFRSERSGNSELWVMDADGNRARPLTDTPFADEYHPDW